MPDTHSLTPDRRPEAHDEQITKGTAWEAGISFSSFPALSGEAKLVNVAIIGGGITGIVTAYFLAKEGLSVAVLEKETLGGDATRCTTAYLTQAIDTDFADLITMLGEADAKRVIDSHGAAMELAKAIIEDESIDCEYMECDNILYANDTGEAKSFEDECAAGKKLGLSIEYHPKPMGGFTNAGYLKLRGQAKFHPEKYLRGVVAAAKKRGVHFYEHTEATALEEQPSLRVKTAAGSIPARYVISATYEPFKEPAGLYLKKGIYWSYVNEYEIPRDALPEGLYEGSDNPYHYFRVDAGREAHGHDRLILGGEDHRQDLAIDPVKNFKALADYADACFSGIKLKLVRQWRGPILEPIDGLAYIGPHHSDHILYAFAFSGSGMTYAGIAAMMLRDHIRGIANPWKDLYAASRIPRPLSFAIKAVDYAGEIAGGAIKNAIEYDSEKEAKA